jgi:hypothetical protein
VGIKGSLLDDLWDFFIYILYALLTTDYSLLPTHSGHRCCVCWLYTRCLYMYVCMYVSMYGCVYGCMYVCMCVYQCIYIYIYIYIYICMYVCMYVYVCICMYVCMYISACWLYTWYITHPLIKPSPWDKYDLFSLWHTYKTHPMAH